MKYSALNIQKELLCSAICTGNFKWIRRLLAESDFQANNFEKYFDKKLYLLKSCSEKVKIYYKSHKKKQRTQFQGPKNQINFDIVIQELAL